METAYLIFSRLEFIIPAKVVVLATFLQNVGHFGSCGEYESEPHVPKDFLDNGSHLMDVCREVETGGVSILQTVVGKEGVQPKVTWINSNGW
jgi:hypothetical protein